MSRPSSLRKDQEAYSTVSQTPEELLNMSLRELVPEPLRSDAVKGIGRVVDFAEAKRAILEEKQVLLERERKVDAGLGTSLIAIKPALRVDKKWYDAHEAIGEYIERDRRTVTRIVKDSSIPLPRTSQEQRDTAAAPIKRKVCSIPEESEPSQLTQEAISAAQEWLGRRIRF